MRMTGHVRCPFCDGDRVILDGAREEFYVRCGSCAAEGPWGKSPESAINAWNRRLLAESQDKPRLPGRARPSASTATLVIGEKCALPTGGLI